MGWVTGFMTFIIIWWLIFFMVLPFGIRTSAEAGIEENTGNARSSPIAPRLWLKAAVTTILSGIGFICFYYIAEYDVLGVRDFLSAHGKN